MPYNYKGDLYKREIVKKLQDMGFDVKSVNALNKIMEKMGLLIHYGNGWGTTDAGAKFSMWHKGVLNSDSWHPELVDEIAKSTKNTVEEMIRGAKRSVLITGYSLSGYFTDLVDVLIEKSQKGVYVKFFVNNIENQKGFDKLCRYKGRFLHIYNFAGSNDSMAALHAKVISVDENQTLITSANLSYHGQEGNIELGMLVDSREIAKQVDDIFTHLVFTKVVKEI